MYFIDWGIESEESEFENLEEAKIKIKENITSTKKYVYIREENGKCKGYFKYFPKRTAKYIEVKNEIETDNEDKDSSLKIWEFFKEVYKNKIQIDTGLLKKEVGKAIRYTGTFTYRNKDKILLQVDEKDSTRGKTITFAGDCSFNFNIIKVSYFYDVVDADDKQSEKCKKQIKELISMCSNYHHALVNIGILPRTGGLNNTKQAIGNDRFDTFIWGISMYFDGYNTLIKDNGNANVGYGNRRVMCDFLDYFFGGTNKFCKNLYQIDSEEFIKKLKESGSKSIDSCNRIFEYIKLAIEFWCKRAAFFCSNEFTEAKYKSLNGNAEDEIEKEFKDIVECIEQLLV